MRAPGDPQGVFANESQMDLIAKELRMDAAPFCRMNLMQDGELSPVGKKISHIKGRESLDRLLLASKYHGPKKANVGRGLALIQWLALGGECSVFVRVDAEKGCVTIASAMVGTRVLASVRCSGRWSLMNCRSTPKQSLSTPSTPPMLRRTPASAPAGRRGPMATLVTMAVTNAKQELFSVAAQILISRANRTEDFQRRCGE